MDLRDGRGEYIGRIEREGNQDTAYDATGRMVGFSNDNGTYDERGGYVGSPGLLASLLK